MNPEKPFPSEPSQFPPRKPQSANKHLVPQLTYFQEKSLGLYFSLYFSGREPSVPKKKAQSFNDHAYTRFHQSKEKGKWLVRRAFFRMIFFSFFFFCSIKTKGGGRLRIPYTIGYLVAAIARRQGGRSSIWIVDSVQAGFSQVSVTCPRPPSHPPPRVQYK